MSSKKKKTVDVLALVREKPLAQKHLCLNPGALQHEKIEYAPTPAFPREVLACTNLESLDLFRGIAYGGDATIPEEIGRLKKLRTLSLGGLGMRKLPDAIGDLRELRELSLNYAQELAALPRTIGKLTKLESLEMSYTLRLAKLPKEIGGLRSLRSLSISNGGLREVPAELWACRSLEMLVLPDSVTRLPKGIAKLTKLQYLAVSPQALASIAGELPKLTALEGIGLPVRDEGAASVALPETIAELPKLKVLRASFARVTLPASLAGHPTLEDLEVSGNGLTSLEGLVASLPKLTSLEFSDNDLDVAEKRRIDAMMRVAPKKRAGIAKVAPAKVACAPIGEVASINASLAMIVADASRAAAWKGTDDARYEATSRALLKKHVVALGKDALGLDLSIGQGIGHVFRAGKSVVVVEGFFDDAEDATFLEDMGAPPSKRAKKAGTLTVASGAAAIVPTVYTGEGAAKAAKRARGDKGVAFGEDESSLAFALPKGTYDVFVEAERSASWGSAARAILVPR